MTQKEMEKKAYRIKLIQAEREKLDAEQESLESEIKAALETEGVETKQAGPFRISWKTFTSLRFDSKRFKADHLDVYQMYAIPSTSRRFQVS